MAQNPLIKAWKYMSAWFGAQVDEKADPKIQIQQAIQEAQRSHEALSRQAASVIGNQRQLEMKLDRQLGTVEDLKAQARQALVLADKARADGDEAKAGEFESTAQALATQLVNAEQSTEDLKQLHDQALGAAQQAREAVRSNALMLEQKLSERTKLLSQLDQAKMQEQVSASLNQISNMAAPTNVPSLDEVRDKIERRYANALGQADLASTSVQGRMLEVRKASMDVAGASRLEEIRASMSASSATPAAVESGADQDAITAGTPPTGAYTKTQNLISEPTAEPAP